MRIDGWLGSSMAICLWKFLQLMIIVTIKWKVPSSSESTHFNFIFVTLWSTWTLVDTIPNNSSQSFGFSSDYVNSNHACIDTSWHVQCTSTKTVPNVHSWSFGFLYSYGNSYTYYIVAIGIYCIDTSTCTSTDKIPKVLSWSFGFS